MTPEGINNNLEQQQSEVESLNVGADDLNKNLERINTPESTEEVKIPKSTKEIRKNIFNKVMEKGGRNIDNKELDNMGIDLSSMENQEELKIAQDIIIADAMITFSKENGINKENLEDLKNIITIKLYNNISKSYLFSGDGLDAKIMDSLRDFYPLLKNAEKKGENKGFNQENIDTNQNFPKEIEYKGTKLNITNQDYLKILNAHIEAEKEKDPFNENDIYAKAGISQIIERRENGKLSFLEIRYTNGKNGSINTI